MEEEQPTVAAVAGGDPLIGRVLEGRYKIVRRIATGGMGRVYVAEQQGLDRVVAIKVLNRLSEDDPRGAPDTQERWRERFFREAKLCSRLTHPNTVRIYDYGKTDDDVYFIAMEYLEGRTLTALLREEGPLDPLRAVNLVMQVCASLAEAHAAGLVHRDLKPDNLIVTRHAEGREFVKVLDFGIVKDLHSAAELPTEAGVVYGSPGYMSPEQILEQPLTPRSDIYSLGAILYKMVTASGLFGSANPVAALTRHVTTQPLSFAAANPSVQVPATLEWVTLQCVAKRPEDRFASMVELGRALRVCELELRGIAADSGPLRLDGGRLVVPPSIEDQLRRFEGDRTPAPSGSRIDVSLDPRSQPTRPTASMTGPALLVLGSLVPLAFGVAVLLVFVALGGWWVLDPTRPAPAPAPVLTPVRAPEPAAPVAAPAPPPPTVPVAVPDPPAPALAAPAPVRRPARPSPAPAPAPAPAVEPAPVPAPAPQPSAAIDPTRRDDLRNPFED